MFDLIGDKPEGVARGVNDLVMYKHAWGIYELKLFSDNQN